MKDTVTSAYPPEGNTGVFFRDRTLDVVKGIGIILMVIGHSGSSAHDFIYLFHMALFFMASGYLWNDSKAKDMASAKGFILSRLKGLLLPYAVCNGIFTLLNNILVSLHINPENCQMLSLGQTGINLLKNMLFAGDTSMGGATWFFRTLFFVSVAHLVVRYICLHWKYGKVFFGVVVAVAFAGAVVVDHTRITLPMGISSCFSAYCVFLLGMFLKQGRIMEKVQKWDIPIFFASFALLLLLTPFGPIGIGVGSIVNLPVFCVASLSGWFMTYCAAHRLKGWLASAIAYCGTRSVWIVTLHFLAFKPVAAVYLLITGADMSLLASFPVYQKPYLWIAYTIVGIGLPLLACRIWHSLLSRLKKPVSEGRIEK